MGDAGDDISASVAIRLLHKAAALDDTRAIKALLADGINVNAVDHGYGGPPVYTAASHNSLAALRVLLKRGAVVNALSDDGETSLHRAVELGYRDVIKLLLLHGADPGLRSANGLTAEDVARANGQSEIAELVRTASARRHTVMK